MLRWIWMRNLLGRGRLQIYLYEWLLVERLILFLPHVVFKLTLDFCVKKLKERLLGKVIVKIIAELQPRLQPRSGDLYWLTGGGLLLELIVILHETIEVINFIWHLVGTEQPILIAL